MKICVYAICKNESNMVSRWLDSIAREADYVTILDTGSTDDTYDTLCNLSDNSYYSDEWPYKAKLIVEQYDYKKELGYFRFDKARNDSMKLIPNDVDICVVSDLDEVYEPGWSEILKQKFAQGYNQVQGYIINYNKAGKETFRYRSNKTHNNSPFWIWTRAIHEGIDYYGNEQVKTCFDPNLVVHHKQDQSKDRSLYRELLEYSCKEFPKDPYYGIYLGIELMNRGCRAEAVTAFKRCLDECDFTDNMATKCQTYLDLSSATDDLDEALTAALSAKQIAYNNGIKSRRIYVKLADVYEKLGDNKNAIICLENALNEVPTYSSDWTDDKLYFGGYIEDRLSLFYYYKSQNYAKALEFASKAIQLDPDNNRILNNMKFYYDALIKSKEN